MDDMDINLGCLLLYGASKPTKNSKLFDDVPSSINAVINWSKTFSRFFRQQANTTSETYLPSYMQEADVLVFPSLTEGLPNAVLEAMSMKLVVILTRVDGHLEIAQNVGSILVDINNPQQLFEAILHYYKNPKEVEMGGEINRNFILNLFSWNKHAKDLYHMYKFLANKRMILNEKY